MTMFESAVVLQYAVLLQVTCSGTLDAGGLELLEGSIEQGVDDLGVPASMHDADAQVGAWDGQIGQQVQLVRNGQLGWAWVAHHHTAEQRQFP